MTIKDIRKIIRFYKLNCPYNEIANFVGIRESSVKWIIEQYKVGKIKE